eukprot:4158412-Pleurochrysis_carterae.AAC.2
MGGGILLDASTLTMINAGVSTCIVHGVNDTVRLNNLFRLEVRNSYKSRCGRMRQGHADTISKKNVTYLLAKEGSG